MKTKKNKIIFLIMTLLMISSVSALTGHIYHQVTEDNDVEILVTYFNHDEYNARDLKIKAYMPDYYAQSQGFKIRAGETGKKYVYLETQNPTSGYHPLIIRTVNDQGIREKRHTWVYIE